MNLLQNQILSVLDDTGKTKQKANQTFLSQDDIARLIRIVYGSTEARANQKRATLIGALLASLNFDTWAKVLAGDDDQQLFSRTLPIQFPEDFEMPCKTGPLELKFSQEESDCAVAYLASLSIDHGKVLLLQKSFVDDHGLSTRQALGMARLALRAQLGSDNLAKVQQFMYTFMMNIETPASKLETLASKKVDELKQTLLRFMRDHPDKLHFHKKQECICLGDIVPGKSKTELREHFAPLKKAGILGKSVQIRIGKKKGKSRAHLVNRDLLGGDASDALDASDEE